MNDEPPKEWPNRSAELIRSATAMAIVSTLMAGWRFVVRLRKSPWLGLSDWFMLGGVVSYDECFHHEVELTTMIDPELCLLHPLCNFGCEWWSRPIDGRSMVASPWTNLFRAAGHIHRTMFERLRDVSCQGFDLRVLNGFGLWSQLSLRHLDLRRRRCAMQLCHDVDLTIRILSTLCKCGEARCTYRKYTDFCICGFTVLTMGQHRTGSVLAGRSR